MRGWRRGALLFLALLFAAVFGLGGLSSSVLALSALYSALSAEGGGVALVDSPLRNIFSTPVPRADQGDQAPTTTFAGGPDRLNILILGVDRRAREMGQPSRSDTVIVVTFDRRKHTAGVLSIPRDLWVEIPNTRCCPRQDKITAAHAYGELDRYPDGKNPRGGIELVRATVELNFGVPIDRYVELEFRGFVRIVDALGGVDIDVPRRIEDWAYPTEDYGTMYVRFDPGPQHMDGERALQYVRIRHPDSDFYRMERQQLFLAALRKKAVQLNVLPKIPELFSALRDAVVTDFSLAQILMLAPAVFQMDQDAVVFRDIGPSMVYSDQPIYGALLPRRAEIGAMISELFSAQDAPTGGG